MRKILLIICMFVTIITARPSSDRDNVIDYYLSRCSSLKETASVMDIIKRSGRLSSIPVASPVDGVYRISGIFGYREHPILHRRMFHSGIDMALTLGSTVHATADGIVIYADRKGGYGRCVIIKHAFGYETIYAHLSAYYALKGDIVKAGKTIGFVGSSGRSTGNHLHYETRKNGKPVEPYIVSTWKR